MVVLPHWLGPTSATTRLRWSAAVTESLISERGITPDGTTKNERRVFVFHKNCFFSPHHGDVAHENVELAQPKSAYRDDC